MNNCTIPKIIHYCWFGNKEKPKKLKKIINSWKNILKDYTFIEWNENNFDINNSCQFVKDAYNQKKWAFVSDYVRIKALIDYGGIYLDTDVKVLKPFDDYLNNKLFISQESEISLCTAVIGSIKENVLLKKFLNEYENMTFHFSKDIEANSVKIKKFIENNCLVKINFNDEVLNNDFHIYKRSFFCGKDIYTYKLDINENTVSIHQLDATWYSSKYKFLKKCKKCVMFVLNFLRR